MAPVDGAEVQTVVKTITKQSREYHYRFGGKKRVPFRQATIMQMWNEIRRMEWSNKTQNITDLIPPLD